MPELTSSRLAEEFPGNEWLVADIYDKYRADPGSVDRKWADIFRRMESESADDGAAAPSSSTTPPPASASSSATRSSARGAADAGAGGSASSSP
uniref:2-oxoglutarate dehydrogenase E1 subunit family protein n=1 Tax=Nesterenkonia sp. F TaxID=795955 RepID=UPI001111EAD5